MTKASKARLLAEFAKHLADYDALIYRNIENEAAVKSLQEEYKKLIVLLADIRDTPTTD